MNIITTRVEHPAVLEPCRFLAEQNQNLIELGVDSSGQIDLTELREALNLGPAIVSVMWANNETGVVFPMDQVAAMVRKEGGILHTDAVQAAGKLPIDMRRIPVDMLSISGHKLHAPKGVGVLYVRRGTRIKPFMLGGHQENTRGSGTCATSCRRAS